MRTEHLIRSLANDVPPVPRRAVERRILMGLVAGTATTIGLVALWLGLRSDMGDAVTSFPFWMKTGYTLAIGIGAIAATTQLARPDSPRSHWLWLLFIPFGLLGGVAMTELMAVPRSEWLSMWLGHSWRECPTRLLLLAVPVFIGQLWAFRRLAPARLGEAGMAAGILSGACAATAYALHCPEVSACFVLTWYTLGIVLAGLLGRLVGPFLLRW